MLRTKYKTTCRSEPGARQDWDITCSERLPLNNNVLQNYFAYGKGYAVVLLSKDEDANASKLCAFLPSALALAPHCVPALHRSAPLRDRPGGLRRSSVLACVQV